MKGVFVIITWKGLKFYPFLPRENFWYILSCIREKKSKEYILEHTPSFQNTTQQCSLSFTLTDSNPSAEWLLLRRKNYEDAFVNHSRSPFSKLEFLGFALYSRDLKEWLEIQTYLDSLLRLSVKWHNADCPQCRCPKSLRMVWTILAVSRTNSSPMPWIPTHPYRPLKHGGHALQVWGGGGAMEVRRA